MLTSLGCNHLFLDQTHSPCLCVHACSDGQAAHSGTKATLWLKPHLQNTTFQGTHPRTHERTHARMNARTRTRTQHARMDRSTHVRTKAPSGARTGARMCWNMYALCSGMNWVGTWEDHFSMALAHLHGARQHFSTKPQLIQMLQDQCSVATTARLMLPTALSTSASADCRPAVFYTVKIELATQGFVTIGRLSCSRVDREACDLFWLLLPRHVGH